MSLARSLGGGSSASTTDARARVSFGYEEHRRAVRSSELGAGTLACARCDAPVAIGEQSLTPDAPMHCPFCSHHGAVRDFLTLGPPLRAARVVVRIRTAAAAS